VALAAPGVVVADRHGISASARIKDRVSAVAEILRRRRDLDVRDVSAREEGAAVGCSTTMPVKEKPWPPGNAPP
jgi:hypothetical protein